MGGEKIPINPTIGHAQCPDCGLLSYVRKNKKGFYYYGCKSCGVNMTRGAKLQKYLRESTNFIDKADSDTSLAVANDGGTGAAHSSKDATNEDAEGGFFSGLGLVGAVAAAIFFLR